MSADTELLRDLPDTVIRGEVATSAATDVDRVRVLLPIDGWETQHGPFRWPRYGDGLRPTRGDPCVVVQDHTGRLSLVAWDPKD
jgi:hypothetical protein